MGAETVLVTGGAGFVGSELVDQLVASGRQVIVLDSLVNGKRENLAGLAPGAVRLVVGDIRDDDLLGTLLPGVSTVFHLACLGLRHSLRSPEENHAVNATGTLRLVGAARAAGVERFVHVSTSEVYGTARAVPMGEDHPTAPTTVYGAAKLAGEAYARALHSTHGFPVVIVRPFNSFGPRCHHEGDSGEVIPRFLLRALAGRPMVIFGDGAQTRDFTHVTDTARGTLLAGLAEEAVGRTINLGSGRETSIADLASAVARLAGRPGAGIVHDAPRPGDVRRLCADAALARRLLGWEPRVTLEDGLARLRDWYAARGVSAEELLEAEAVRSWEVAEAGRHGP